MSYHHHHKLKLKWRKFIVKHKIFTKNKGVYRDIPMTTYYRENLQDRLFLFYSQHNPKFLIIIPQIIEAYKGYYLFLFPDLDNNYHTSHSLKEESLAYCRENQMDKYLRVKRLQKKILNSLDNKVKSKLFN